jgi:hypothetical protein
LLFALAVEMAAMSVLLIAETTTGHREGTVLVPSAPLVRRREREQVVGRGRVIDWLRERAVPADHTTATALDVLHADYEAWCMQMELLAGSMDAFAEEFDRIREIPELAGNIKKRGNRYYGIKLAGTTVARLPG